MKHRLPPKFARSPVHLGLGASSFGTGRSQLNCSLGVLACLGALALALPQGVLAQNAGAVLPRGTVPVLRGLVAGQATFSTNGTTTGNAMVINQTSQTAIISWNKFNIANGSSVEFKQPGITSSALNRIYDNSPSIIQGMLKANGQVILINQNGIMFDRGAQVNAYSMITSTLNMSNARYNIGLTAGGTTTPAFEGGYDGLGNTIALRPDGTRPAGISLGLGGDPSMAAPSLKSDAGGSIVLIAPTIDNRSGVITSPDGQVILAAGSKAYLALSDSSSLRGLRVEIGSENGTDPVDVTSMIRNAGEISADRGNVTLAALAINQEGRVSASTAMLYNGSVVLKARSMKPGVTLGSLLPDQDGRVTLASGSVTATPLDTADKTTMAESQNYADSQDDRRGSIRIEGKEIDHFGTVQAPGGKIDMVASDLNNPGQGRLYLGEGSVVDASGAWSDVAYDSNMLTFKVTSNELKDSPEQKDGLLRGQTVTVDLRKGSSILDLSGYIGGRQRSLAEKAAIGGEVNLSSQGDLIQRHGATIDVSGGGYRYGGGVSNTSKLLGADGKVYDITNASKDKQYVMQLDKFTRTDRFGRTTVWETPGFGSGVVESAYLEGKSGGTLNITSKGGMVLDGQLKGGATAGTYQLNAVPRGATLTLGSTADANFMPLGNVDFTATSGNTLADAFTSQSVLSEEQAGRLVLGMDTLFPAGETVAQGFDQNKFGSVTLNSAGVITLPENVTLDAGVGSTLALNAQQIDIGGKVTAAAGNVSLRAASLPSGTAPDRADHIYLGSQAEISVSGLWLNNASTDGSAVGPLLPTGMADNPSITTAAASTLNGGSIQLKARAMDLSDGSLLDASGGGSLNASKKLTAGNGGKIAIDATPPAGLPVLASHFGAETRGYALGTGGSLNYVVGQAQIGGVPPSGDVVRFSTDFFSRGGFSSYDINGVRGLEIADGATVQPLTQTLVLDPLQAVQLVSGSSVADAAQHVVLLADQRKATSIALRATGGQQGELTMGNGASIVTDPRGSITLAAEGGMDVNGRLVTSGGTITLNLSGPAEQTGPTLHLGQNAQLLAAGDFIAKPNDLGLRQGTVVGGGTVTLNAVRAGIVADAGSRIDVSGASRVLDLPSSDPTQQPSATQVSADAGAVVVRTQEGAQLDGSIRAFSPGATSAGGSFALEFTNRDDGLVASTGNTRRIVVTQNPGAVTAQPGTADAVVDVRALQNGGFDKLRLQAEDRIELPDTVDVQFARGVRFDAPELRVGDGARATVNGASVVIANSFGATPDGKGSTSSTTPSAFVATQRGTGVLDVHGQTVDVIGDVTLNGTSHSTLASDSDLRLSGRVVGDKTSLEGAVLTGSLTSAGDITLQARQVYPTTRSNFTVAIEERSAQGLPATPVAGGKLDIVGTGGIADTVYSAGGKLTARADQIVQGGVVKAPLGQIDLQAGSSLVLGRNSVTSVSANGATIPYGTTDAGVSWLYGSTNASTGRNDLKTPPAKSISLTGPSITQEADALIDLSGGGDLQAVEFVKGSGGTSDTLLKDNTFAIIPKARLASMPIDSDIALAKDLGFGVQSARQDTVGYNSIHIGPGAIVPEGDYVLLPGRYALLPDAYMVTLQTGSAYINLAANQTSSLTNGQTVVTGYRTVAGTGIRESGTVGVVVRPGTDAKRESDYNITGSAFFARLADQQRLPTPQLPADAGHLSISADQSLKLNGSFATAAADKGQGAMVDIAAPKIAIVSDVGQAGIAGDYLQLDADDLSRINGSLLIGGTRSDSAPGTVQTRASDVIVANSASSVLKAPELLLAATDTLTVKSGSVVSGEGTIGKVQTELHADPSGALIRVSSGEQAAIERGTTPDTSRGTVQIESGATLKAAKSLLIDATQSTTSQGQLQVADGGALSLAAGRIALGETAGVSGLETSLVLTDAQLAAFDKLGALALKSYGDIDLYGTVNLGSTALKQLTLDAGTLRGQVAGGSPVATHLAAGEVVLKNTSAAVGTASHGSGSFTVDAGRIVIGSGDKAVSGFAGVALNAGTDVVADGNGSWKVGGTLDVASARIVGSSGAEQTWRAADEQDPTNPVYFETRLKATVPTAALADANAFGSRLGIEGQSIESGANILMKAGRIGLSALGGDAADGVRLTQGAVVDASGASRNFNGNVAVANAGTVDLSSRAGTVALASGATVQLDAAAAGGSAGTLNITAQGVQIDGMLSAKAGTGRPQGQVSLDIGSLPNFSAVNAKLNEGGFSSSRSLRVRQGDLHVGTAASDSITAQNILLVADQGRIDIDGTLDASSTQGGGRIEVFAQNGLAVGDTGVVNASGTGTATSATSNGGTVLLDTRSGTLTFDDGAKIDVRAGEKGKTGQVTFTAARTAGNDGVDADLRGTVLSQRHAGDAAGSVAVEARRVYTTDGFDLATDITNYAADQQAFLASANAAAATGGIKGDSGAPQGNVQLRGAVEVQSLGDLTLNTDWDLTSADWLATGANGAKLPGTLTIRSAGNLTLENSLGMPNDNLVDAQTWNIRLVGGADLASANVMRTQPLSEALTAGTGSVTLSGPDAKVRTGTGEIRIAAATDFVINDDHGVVYTSGLQSAPNPNTSADAPNPASGVNGPWVKEGGSIQITAQRDAIGTSNQWVNDWLRRPRGASANVLSRMQGWWAYRPNFHQNIGSFGGGNIDIAAGHDVNSLSAMLPTSGRSLGANGTGPFDVQGGGNLNVTAGHDIKGGEYLVARGEGVLRAGGAVGTELPTQLYLMGISGDAASQKASIQVEAARGIDLQSVDDPISLGMTRSAGPSNVPNFGIGSVASSFDTYSENAKVGLTSLSGDILLGARPMTKPPSSVADGSVIESSAAAGSSYPANLSAVAFAGDISGKPDQSIRLAPSINGTASLLADQNVRQLDLTATRTSASGTTAPGSYAYDVQALNGSISDSMLNLPAVSRLRAGLDIVNTGLTLQNLNDADVSVVQADTGDIRTTELRPTLIYGAGRLLLQAGRNVSLGGQLTAAGNANNTLLTSAMSARLTVLAGVSGEVHLDKLDDAYKELIEAGKAKDNDRATAAMKDFFGEAKIGAGNLDSFLTSIQTFGGSDIDLIVPKGDITVGLTTPGLDQQRGVITNAGGAIRSYLSGNFNINQGKVTTAQGGDVLIYTSEGNIDAGRGAKTSATTPPPQRVPVTSTVKDPVTGEDVIDPETGAPITVITGYRYILPIAVSGSGIQTATSDPDGAGPIVAPPSGSIFLFAPSGFVDAGEAGIKSGADIFIAAQLVLNASNISAQGSSVGVPRVEVSGLASSVGNSTTGSKAGDEAAAAATNAARAAAAAAETRAKPAILTVEVLGFGDGNCKETQKDCFAK